jgi:hypothetical protein
MRKTTGAGRQRSGCLPTLAEGNFFTLVNSCQPKQEVSSFRDAERVDVFGEIYAITMSVIE